jgi:DNA mismatch repair protein MutS
MSIAKAVVEYIYDKNNNLGCKTLFATHYHELTEMENKFSGVVNYNIAVKKRGDEITFLRKIVKGGADDSFGIQVAKLAGVPDMIIDRAKEILAELIDKDIMERVQNIAVPQKSDTKSKTEAISELELNQMSLFDTVKDEDVIEELKGIDISTLTPLDALNTLYRLQSKLNNRW